MNTVRPFILFRRTLFVLGGAGLIIIVTSHVAKGQNLDAMMYQNMMQQQALDAQINAHLQQGQQQLNGLIQDYVNQNRPQLEAETAQYNQITGQQLSVEQYAQQKVQNEAQRRNAAQQPQVNPIFEAQKRQFEAGQRAHFQRQENYAAQNNAWQQQQQQIDDNYGAWKQGQRQIDSDNNRFIQQGVYEKQYYRNPETGQVVELPFSEGPGVYGNDNGTWVGSMGNFQQVGPNGVPQQMEEYQPDYYDE